MDAQTRIDPQIDLDPSHSADVESRIRKMIGNTVPDAETQLALAEALFDKGDDVEAVRVLQQLIYTDPTCIRAYDRLVDSFTRMERRRDAAETYRAWGRQLAGRSQGASTNGTAAIADPSVTDRIAAYYAIRAPEYEQTSSYMSPSAAEFMDGIKSELRAVVKDRDAIEIACGTGYWTQVASESARSVLATDRNVELVEIVGNKMASAANVRCQVADAYTLDGVGGPFSAAYAQFWWSHIPRSMLKVFLSALHSKLQDGAQVFFMDSMPYFSRGGRRLDEEGNVFEPRVLMNGEKYEVMKNFPTETELREVLEGISDELVYKEYEDASVWTVSYRARCA